MVKQQKVIERFWSVKQIHIFRDLSEADVNVLEQLTTFRRLTNGEQLCVEGVYLLKEGRVKIYETPPEGEPVSLEVLEPGEMFGAVQWKEDKAHPNVVAETLTEVVVGIVNVKNFQFFLKRKPHLTMPPQKPLTRYIQHYLHRWDAGKNLIRKAKRDRKDKLTFSSFFHSFTSPVSPFAITEAERLANPFLNIVFRSPASRLALLLQNYADAPKHNRSLIGRRAQRTLHKLSTKKISRLIGSSVEKTETLLNTFKQHKIVEKRFRRIHILNPWQLKKIANARMETLSQIQKKNETYEQNEPLFADRPADGR